MPVENPIPVSDVDSSRGLTPLADLPQLYHARDAHSDTEQWRVAEAGPEGVTSNVYNGVFYLTPHIEEAAHHVRGAAVPTIHSLDVTDPSAKVMNGEDFHPSFAATLKQNISDVLQPTGELNSLALAKLTSADESEYTYRGAVYSLEGNIAQFASRTLPDGIYPWQWESAIETYVSAINAQRLLTSGSAHLILQGVLDYTINPDKSFVYAEVGKRDDGETVRAWFPVNRQYLVKALTNSNIVGVTKTIDRFGPPANTPTNTSVVFNNAVMLWQPEAVQTSGLIDAEQTEHLVNAARSVGRIPLKGSVEPG